MSTQKPKKFKAVNQGKPSDSNVNERARLAATAPQIPKMRPVPLVRDVVLDYSPQRLSALVSDKLAELSREQIVLKGEPILPLVSSLDKLVFLQEGTATIHVHDTKGFDLLVGIAGGGEWFGELGFLLSHMSVPFDMINDENCAVSVVAAVDCKVRRLSYANARKLCDIDQTFERQLFAQTALRMKRTSQWLIEKVSLEVQHSVYNLLVRMAGHTAWDAMTHPQGYVLRVTRTDVAQYLGCSRESVGRALSALSEAGAIEVKGKSIIIKKPYRYYRSGIEVVYGDE